MQSKGFSTSWDDDIMIVSFTFILSSYTNSDSGSGSSHSLQFSFYFSVSVWYSWGSESLKGSDLFELIAFPFYNRILLTPTGVTA
jgi:hypothetical protein